MAKLTRLTGKVFAGSADMENLGVFGSAKAGNPTNPTSTGTEAQIQAPAAYGTGWTSAVVTSRNFPPIEEVNGVLRTISYQNCYLLQEGIPTFDINTEYSDTSIVKNVGNGGELILYVSLQDNNIGHQPGAEGSEDYWTRAVFVGSSAIGVPQITLNYNLVDAPENCVWLEGAEDGIPDNAQGYDCDFPNLYAIYGTDYNDEDTPEGKYKLPDFRNRVLWGGETAGYLAAGLPNIKGSIWYNNNSNEGLNSDRVYGAFTRVQVSNNQGSEGDGTHSTQYTFNANDGASYVSAENSGIYNDNCHTVQPPAIKFRAYTRYQ